MKKQLLITSFLLFSLIITAQTQPFYKTYDWEENPTYTDQNIEDQEIIGLYNNIVSEFYFLDNDNLVEYYLEHETILLNSDKQIEEYNKVYLPYGNRSEIVLHKARVINKDGSVKEIGADKIFDATNEETGRQLQYFALEGLEKGSILERMYVYKRYPQYNGRYLRLQEDYDKHNVKFQLFAPTNLVFDFKSYNGLAPAEEMELEDKNHWIVQADYIEGIDEEDGASYNSNTKHVVYKLSANRANPSATFASYATVAKNVFENLKPELSRRDNRALEKFVKKAVEGNSFDEKLRSLDSYIKNNFYKDDSGSGQYDEIGAVLKNKIGSDSGLLKIYLAALNYLNIDHQVVLTSSRSDIRFDPDFEAYNFLKEYLIYFPDTEKYVSPTDFSSRYGYPDSFLTDNYGLFIKEVTVANFSSSVGEIKFIDAVPADMTKDIMKIDVKFDNTNPSLIHVDLYNEMTGYSAMYIQPFYSRADDKIKEEILTSYAQRLTEDLEIIKKEARNVEKGSFGTKPLIMDFELESKDFIEKAGNKSLFKLGKLIGKQSELYQEKERKLPYENSHNRLYDRVITVELPEGYTVANLEDIKIEREFKNEAGKTVFFFKSDYVLEGNTLKVTADEFYDQAVVMPEDYEKYRQVINAAADFEKVTLILNRG